MAKNKEDKKKYAVLLLLLLLGIAVIFWYINQPKATYLYVYSPLPLNFHIGTNEPVPFNLYAGNSNIKVLESNIKTNNQYLTILNIANNFNNELWFTPLNFTYMKTIQFDNGYLDERINLIPSAILNNNISLSSNSFKVYYYSSKIYFILSLPFKLNKTNYLYLSFTPQTIKLYRFTDLIAICQETGIPYYNNNDLLLYKGNITNESNLIPPSTANTSLNIPIITVYNQTYVSFPQNSTSGSVFGAGCLFYRKNITNGVYTLVANFPNITNNLWNKLGLKWAIGQKNIINESGNKITFLLNNSAININVFTDNFNGTVVLKNNCPNSFLYFYAGDKYSLNSNENLIEMVGFGSSFSTNTLSPDKNYTVIAFSPNSNTHITWNITNPYYKIINFVDYLEVYKITTENGTIFRYNYLNSMPSNNFLSIPTNSNLTNLYFSAVPLEYSNITITCN